MVLNVSSTSESMGLDPHIQIKEEPLESPSEASNLSADQSCNSFTGEPVQVKPVSSNDAMTYNDHVIHPYGGTLFVITNLKSFS